jgi:hypothetical protein
MTNQVSTPREQWKQLYLSSSPKRQEQLDRLANALAAGHAKSLSECSDEELEAQFLDALSKMDSEQARAVRVLFHGVAK